MDRRTFTKTIAALFAAPAVLAEEVTSAASMVPGVAGWTPHREMVLGHYGFTNMSMTTTFPLEQVFGLGQLELPDPFDSPDPIIEADFSFFLDADRKTERTVYFKGNKKEWKALVEVNEAARAYKDMGQDMLPVIEDMNQPSKHRKYYGATNPKFFIPDSDERVPAKCVEKDKFYTIHVDIGDDFEHPTCRIILTNFKAIDIQDFTEDEVDFQLEKC
jgi:hypothetical protein